MDPFDADYRAHIENIRTVGLKEEQRIELTCSSVPGTTLRISRVPVPSLGLRLYDTPGLTLSTQHFAHVHDLHLLKGFTNNNPANPLGVNLEPQKTLWIGGVCRIDSFSVGSPETWNQRDPLRGRKDLCLQHSLQRRNQILRQEPGRPPQPDLLPRPPGRLTRPSPSANRPSLSSCQPARPTPPSS